MDACQICFDELRKGVQKARCGEKWVQHSVCKPCFQGLVRTRCERADNELDPEELAGGCIRLPCPADNCRSFFDPFNYMHFMHNAKDRSKSVDRVYYERCATLREETARRDAEADLSDVLASNGIGGVDFKNAREEKMLERTLQEQYRNPRFPGLDPTDNTPEPKFIAWMCPECEVGPVGRDKCKELNSHHGETTSGTGGLGGGRVSNACDNCGFFADNIDAWRMWDGKLRRAEEKGTPGHIAEYALNTTSASEAVASGTESEDSEEEEEREAGAAAAAAANAAIANELYVEHPTSAESSGDSETPAWFADVISMLYNVFEDRFSFEELERTALDSGGDVERAIATLL